MPVRERILALDVVRGVAVGGILLANVLVFFGLTFLPPDRAAALNHTAADHAALFLERVLVDGKFYSTFSLLFGIGFGVQLSRGGAAALPRFKRRLRILLGIGAIHAFFIWAGDILMLYALLGFTMPWFARVRLRPLVANRRSEGGGDRCHYHRRPDPAQCALALALPIRSGRVDMAPAHLRQARLSIRGGKRL